MKPDVVIPYKGASTGSNNELRFTLRSLVNVPHRNVYIVGGELPRWVRNVTHLAVQQDRRDKFTSQTRNYIELAKTHYLSEHVYIFNDDMYVLHQMPKIEVMNTGLLATHKSKAREQAIRYLRDMGVAEPLCFEGHFPMPVHFTDFVFTCKHLPPKLHRWKRSIYGNMHHLEGQRYFDVKVHGRLPQRWRDRMFLSSDERGFDRYQRGALMELFPHPGPYETSLA